MMGAAAGVGPGDDDGRRHVQQADVDVVDVVDAVATSGPATTRRAAATPAQRFRWRSVVKLSPKCAVSGPWTLGFVTAGALSGAPG